jgi:hypothetical protein
LNFQKQNPLKNQYLPHLSSENCERSSTKSDSLRAFQQHQEHSQIPIQILVSILFNFHWENHSTINSFHNVAPNTLKPNLWCTHTHQELSEDTKSEGMKHCGVVREIPWRQNKTKQNKLPCFITRFVSQPNTLGPAIKFNTNSISINN